MATITGSKRLLTISADAMAADNTLTLGGNGVATQTWVNTQLANLVDSAPATLDTLNELAAALGDDPNFATTISNQIAGKLDSTHDMTLTLTGDASGSATFTNMGNATLTVTVANDSHTHDGRYLQLSGGTLTGTLNAKTVQTRNTFPEAHNSYDLGTTGVRYRNVYAVNLYGDGSNITGLSTGANYYLDGLSFDTGTGILTASVNGATNQTVDLDGRYLTSFDITTQTDPKYLRSNEPDTATGLITFSGGITGFTNSAGISGNNYNITGVNQLTINDPGEGIVFSGTTNLTLAVIDDASDNILNLAGTNAKLQVNGTDVLTAHPNISAATSVNNSGRTYIQDITLDSNGHVTGIISATETVVNTNTTYSAGAGLDLTGTTFSHTDTSSQSTVNNSNGTVIQDVTLDTYGHVTSLGSVNLDGRYYTESEINTGNITTSGTWTFNGVVNGLYHSVEEDHYYFDDYNGRRNVNAFLKTQYSDIIKFREVADLEYWNGSAWIDGSSQLNNLKNLLDGRKDTNWYVGSTYYKFRFSVTASTSWPTMALIGVESSWTGSSFPGFEMIIEEQQADSSWSTIVTADFTSSNGVSTWGTMFKADSALHTGRGGQTLGTRITIDFYGWNPSNPSYTTIPLQNIFIYSNFSGIANNDYHNLLNYDRHVTAPNKLFITTTDTNTSSTTALVLNGTEVEKRTLGSNAFNSTPIPTVNNATLTVQGTGALGGSGTFTANASSNATISITHDDTSTLSGSYGGNNNGVVIEDITVDGYGHVTAIGTRDLDSRFDAAGSAATAEANAIAHADDRIDNEVFPAIPTNNNQLINGAGYVTSSGNTIIGTDSDINTSGYTIIDNLYMTDGVITSHGSRNLTNIHAEDTRAAEKVPNDYLDKSLSVEFTDEFASLGAWYSGITVKGWSDNYTAWQLISSSNTSTNNELYFRTGTGTSWNSLYKVWHNGNLDAFVGASVSNDTITFTKANGGTVAVTTSDANTNYYLTGLSYNSGSSVLTATVSGAANPTLDLTNKIYADALAVSGNGTTAQFLRSDGDGTFTWATPSNTTYSAGAGLLLSGTTFAIDYSNGADALFGSNSVQLGTPAPSSEILFSDTGGAFKEAIGNVPLSAFNNDLGWTSNTGDITSVRLTGDSGYAQDTSGAAVFTVAGGTGITTSGSGTTLTITSTVTDTTYSAGSGLQLSGTTFSVDVVDGTTQTTAANARTTTSGRTYAIQFDASGNLVVNVPWVDTNTNTTYTADGNYGMTLSGTAFRLENDRRRNSSSTDIYTGNTHDYTHYDASHGIRWYTAGSQDMFLTDAGVLHVDSDVIAYSSTISDQSFKDDVVTIENAIDKVKKLRGVKYTWNAGSRKGKKDLGLIAQEVEEVLPEIVHEHEMPLMEDAEAGKTYKTVDYEKMVGVLIEAVKEQQTQIDSLKAQLEQLKSK